MAKKPDHLPEFPSDWHQQDYVEGLRRELIGTERRIGELKQMEAQPSVIAAAERARDSVLAELRRLGQGQKSAAKRPRAAAQKESR